MGIVTVAMRLPLPSLLLLPSPGIETTRPVREVQESVICASTMGSARPRRVMEARTRERIWDLVAAWWERRRWKLRVQPDEKGEEDELE